LDGEHLPAGFGDEALRLAKAPGSAEQVIANPQLQAAPDADDTAGRRASLCSVILIRLSCGMIPFPLSTIFAYYWRSCRRLPSLYQARAAPTRKKETMPIVSRAIRQMYASLVALWAITAIHHAYEAARYPALHYPSALVGGVGAFPVLLTLTLARLGRYERTGGMLAYYLYTAIVVLVWVGLVGVYLSANYYVLRNLLYLTHAAPLATLRDLWSVEQTPPNDLFHEGAGSLIFEGAGSLIFFFAIWVAIAWLRLERERRLTAASPQGIQKANTLT
jgi:hypothetical protein